MEIKNAKYVTSAAGDAAMPSIAPEIAVAGKSNVGKSSFINFLTGNGHLAKTSSTPGKTRKLNYFSINSGEWVLVDMPGYGFARVAEGEREEWERLVERYFSESAQFKHLFMLVDIRHDPTALDLQMLDYLVAQSIPFTVIATKADKLSKMQQNLHIADIAARLKMAGGNILPVSVLAKTGKEAVLRRISQVLNN